MTISELNTMDTAGFIEAVGWVCERSPWVAQRAWNSRPFRSVEHLHSALVHALTQARHEEQLAVLCAHPDLGARAQLSGPSTAEQASVGLLQLAPEEHERLTNLNNLYRSRFGFPFLFAVKGSGKLAILESLEKRLNSSPEEEFDEALGQVARIIGFRLQDTLV